MPLPLGVRPDRDEHLVVHLRLGRLVTLERHAQSLLAGLDPGDLRAQQDAFVVRRDALFERLHEVTVAPRHQPLGEFDDADLDAECRVYRSHLETDDAAADDQQVAWQVEFERARRIEDAGIVRQPRQPHRFGAHRDDAVSERNGGRLASLRRHRDRVIARESADAAQHRHLALLCKTRQSAREARDDLVLPLPQFHRIDGWCAERHTEVRHGLRFFDHFRGMQQRLRRNAADIQAYAAEHRPALDQRDLEPQVSRTKRSGVAARSGA